MSGQQNEQFERLNPQIELEMVDDYEQEQIEVVRDENVLALQIVLQDERLVSRENAEGELVTVIDIHFNRTVSDLI